MIMRIGQTSSFRSTLTNETINVQNLCMTPNITSFNFQHNEKLIEWPNLLFVAPKHPHRHALTPLQTDKSNISKKDFGSHFVML